MGPTDPAQCCCDSEDPRVCIRIVTYSFLCCEQRTYLYVKSDCFIDAIRINGVSITVPGDTYEFGGWPTAPTIMIGEEEVSGVLLTSESCCPNLDDPIIETPYAIAVSAPGCRYDVEVDSCGVTNYCSLRYCLQRQVSLSELVFPGYSNEDSCQSSAELGTYTRTITNDLGPFTIPDFSVDNCIEDEDGQLISIGSWTGTSSNVITGPLSSSSETFEYSGSLYLSIPANSRCVFSRDENYLLFTGTITRTWVRTGPFGGSGVDTTSVTLHQLGYLFIPRCFGDGDDPYVWWGFCRSLVPPILDGLVCDCGGPIISFFGQSSWC